MKSINIPQLYKDFNIKTAPSYHKHSRQGWINTICPFCISGYDRYHLGFNIRQNYFTCYRCGWHSIDSTLTHILKINKQELFQLLKKYKIILPRQSKEIFQPAETIELPEDCGPLNSNHRNYLISRNFNPDYLIKEWNILGTNNWGYYSFRIIAPIYFQNELVSYQGRDYTGKQIPYLACSRDKEVVFHKHILYGFDKAIWNTCIVVEGLFDVWRLGPGALCTFGAKYTPSQLLLIAQNFKKAFLLFDNDPAGWKASDKMQYELENMNVSTEIIELSSGDAGDLDPKTAKEIMKLIRK